MNKGKFLENRKPLHRRGFSIFRREDWIRTSDPLHPIQVRYRAAPLPEPCNNSLQNEGTRCFWGSKNSRLDYCFQL